jgi:menaquinone-dependent protoporphyrinogen IX oxidase
LLIVYSSQSGNTNKLALEDLNLLNQSTKKRLGAVLVVQKFISKMKICVIYADFSKIAVNASTSRAVSFRVL